MSSSRRIQYPLTDEAKAESKRLVELWDTKIIGQHFYLVDHTTGGATDVQLHATLGASRDFQPPPLGILKELNEFKLLRLVYIITDQRERHEVTLLQELRNAVANDFLVSDFFLTVSAVGTIIHGNLDMREGAVMQSAAVAEGTVYQNVSSLSVELRQKLGQEFLQMQPDVAIAIDELEAAPPLTRREKLGRVILELGRSMEHVANAGAIMMVADWLAKLL